MSTFTDTFFVSFSLTTIKCFFFSNRPGVCQEVEGGRQGPDRSIAQCIEALRAATAAISSPGRGSEDLSLS